jgi:hypothetical protein
MHPILLFCLIPWLVGLGQSKANSDLVELSSGQRLSGRVLFDGRVVIVVQTGRGELEVARSSVTSIHSIERCLAEFLRRFDGLPQGNSAAAGELARWCESQGLEHEARNLWLGVLFAEPQNEEAIKGAGARKAGRQIQVRDEKRWIELGLFRAQKPKWRDRVHLETAHFEIETDAPLDQVLHAAVQIERHFLRFYEALGSELVLYVFEERPVIRVYADAKDFPQSWAGGDSTWFAPGENVLHLLTSEHYNMPAIVRSVTDMLLFNACRRSSGKTGQVPGWVAGAISEFFAATAPREPFGPWGQFGVPVQAWFRLQAQDPKPIELKALLRSSLGELRRGNDAARRTAAAYTLGHFLMRGDDGSHREACFKYLRHAWQGKISSNDFFKTIGMSEAELSKRWRAYVIENAP